MNDNVIKIDFEAELSPEESAAMDRLLASVSADDNSRVDYDGMLARIKAAASKEGIVIFPSAAGKKRRGLIKRIALGAATAAAVFVVGLAAMLVLKTVLDDDASGGTAADIDAYATKVPAADHSSAEAAEPVKLTKQPSDSVKITSAPAEEPDPVKNPADDPVSPDQPELSPFPTEFPMRGGSAGYVELDPFADEPEAPSDLVPLDLPSCMNVAPSYALSTDEPNLFAEAFGEDDGKEYSYNCTVVYDLDVDLEVGVAMYKYDEESGHITYIWRITEEAFLIVDFDGFTVEEAQELLASLAEEPDRIDGLSELMPAA